MAVNADVLVVYKAGLCVPCSLHFCLMFVPVPIYVADFLGDSRRFLGKDGTKHDGFPCKQGVLYLLWLVLKTQQEIQRGRISVFTTLKRIRLFSTCLEPGCGSSPS